MITKAQSKRFAARTASSQKLGLSALEKSLLRWSMAERGDKVLDLQVGDGLMLEYLQRNMECEVCGVSDDMEYVRAARSRLRNADITFALREDIPWKENTFDSVYFKMQTVPVTQQTIREAARVMKPGGQLLVGLKVIPAPFRQIAMLLHSEPDEELRKPAMREKVLTMMHDEGLTQITWQPTSLLNSVCIGWKAMPSLDEEPENQ